MISGPRAVVNGTEDHGYPSDLKLTHDGHPMKDKLTEALEWFIEEDIYKEPFIVREKSTVTVTLDNGRKMEILKK